MRNIGNDVPDMPELKRDLAEAGIEPQTAEAVNRTKTGRIDIPVPFPFPPPSDEVQLLKDLKEAQAELAPTEETELSNAAAARTVHGESDAKAQIESILATTGWNTKGMSVVEQKEEYDPFAGKFIPTERKLVAPRDPDLREFKKQVIAAFQHLGLDTKKFFGV